MIAARPASFKRRVPDPAKWRNWIGSGGSTGAGGNFGGIGGRGGLPGTGGIGIGGLGGRHVILVGDVTGHGPGPAMVTAAVATAFRVLTGSGFLSAVHSPYKTAEKSNCRHFMIALDIDKAAIKTDPGLINTALQAFESVTPAQAQAAAKKYLVSTNRTVIDRVPEPKAEGAAKGGR